MVIRMIDKKCFLYTHKRLDKNEIFYVGIGVCSNGKTEKSKCRRAFDTSNRNRYWNNVVNKTKYEVEIILYSEDYGFIKEKEKELIKFYGKKINNTGTLTNITDGGEGTRGCPLTEEHKRAISLSNSSRKGSKRTEEQKLVMSLIKKGKKRKYAMPFTAETRNKMSEIRKTKIGILNSFYGKKHTNDSKIKMGKAVLQFDLSGSLIEEHPTMTMAANKTNSTITLIQKVCKGLRKKHNNFIWKYKNQS